MTQPSLDGPLALGAYSTTDLRDKWVTARPSAVLFPLGSTEPHGPHLPLATDAILAAENATRAATALRAAGVFALVAPTLPYGVTDFAEGFTGATTVPQDALVALVVSAASAWLADGAGHVCLINHHLEPGQLGAVQQAKAALTERFGAGAVSAPQVISRRWGKRLGAEFRSGACHAGSYETSMVLAAAPELVHPDRAARLPEVPVSLSDAIAAGRTSFLQAGADAAYTGRPGDATAAEGQALFEVLTDMVKTEVLEAFAGDDSP